MVTIPGSDEMVSLFNAVELVLCMKLPQKTVMLINRGMLVRHIRGTTHKMFFRVLC